MTRELKIIQNLCNYEILYEELSYLNSQSPDKWAITFDKKNSIRVHFAKLIVLTISNDQIWMSVNPDLIIKGFENIWKWDLDDYPVYTKYKKIIIHNGYLLNPSLENWNKIKKCHYDIINQISKSDFVLDIRTIQNQNKYVFHELSQYYKKDFPIPNYILTEDYNLFKSDEIGDIIDKKIGQTEREQIAKIRIGQNLFREKLLRLHKKCMICGLKTSSLLRASHIKKWSKSENIERLDERNGLLLCALHDSLFDSGLISFSDKGEIIISKLLDKEDVEILKIIDTKIAIEKENIPYLNWHRNNELK